MSAEKPLSRYTHFAWLLLILLTAVFLRLDNLTTVPPGLTHDEADHGITALSILNDGVRQIYFTIGYGREPLYDYLTAAMMSFMGPTYLAGRIVSVYFSILLIAAMFTWVRHAFDSTTALITAAGLAVGFWPVMSGRQALRSTLLPTFFVLAVIFFWFGFQEVQNRQFNSSLKNSRPFLKFTVAGLFLGLTIYSYIPARGLWVIFPALLVYLLIVNRVLFRKIFWPTCLMLLVMLAFSVPLLAYLAANPTSELRIQQLANPLVTAADGNWLLLANNIQQGLSLFFLKGDSAWRYNIAGKPLLGPLMGLLFLIGLITAIVNVFLYRKKNRLPRVWDYGPSSFIALSWLFVGALPVLITGPSLAMTQAIGMQPVLYLFPALALVWAGKIELGGQPLALKRWAVPGIVLLFAMSAAFTYRDYFITWANHPEVRVQYESTLSAAVDYLNEYGRGTAALSTVTPQRYHSPAVAAMRLQNQQVDLRWFDARSSLIIPNKGLNQIMIPGFTPLSPALQPYFSTAEHKDTLQLRDSDLDRPLSIYAVDGSVMLSDWQEHLIPVEANFDDSVILYGYQLQDSPAKPGETLQLVTLWQTKQPLTDALLFAHVMNQSGPPLAQQDQLGVPGASWQPDTWFLQLFEIMIPSETAAGQYPLLLGVYTQPDGNRLPLSKTDEEANLYHLADITIAP